jgi:acyl carrier protein
MNEKEILKQVNDIFIDVLDDEDIVLSTNTTANDVEDWDSLTHIQLIVSVEKSFKIKFTSIEIQRFKNVGHFCTEVKRKLEEKATIA